MRQKLPLLLLLALIAAPARADDQIWAHLIAQGPISGRIITRLELQQRLVEGNSRLGASFARGALGLQVNPGLQLLAGYAYIVDQREEIVLRREHRGWQQAQLRLADTDEGASLHTRTRLEQRWFEGQPDMGWRFRQQLRGQWPLGTRGWAVLANTELLFALDDTRNAQRSGLEQFRLSAGISAPIGKRLTLETLYLNQRFTRPGPDSLNNVAVINLIYRIG